MILGPEYTELRQLGSGASGSVVLVRHEPTGLLLAVKHLSKRLARDDAFLARFRREAETLRRLRHPGVAALYWYVEAGDEAALGMELVNGVTLRQMLDQGATSPEAALLVLRGSLLGLDHVHAAGIVHRDYKPDNVMVDGEGMSRLIDLGIAVPVGRTGVAGTPRYMAPEQWLGEGATPGTDVYAATAVFFECLTGRPPFGGRTARKLRAQHLSSPVAVEEVPEAVRGLVARGMAKEAAERYPTAGVFVTELEAVAASAYGSEWKERGAAALAAAALALAALFPLRGGGPASVGSTGLATATTELAPPLIEADGANRSGLLGWLMRARTKRGLLAAVAAVLALLIGGGTALALAIAGGQTPRSGVAGATTILSGGSLQAVASPTPAPPTPGETSTTTTTSGRTPTPSGTPPPVNPPIAALSSASIAFGNQNVGQPSAARSLTLRDAGGPTLHVGGVTVSGPFHLASDGCNGAAIAEGSSCTVTVTFTPAVAGAASGMLTIADNASPSTQVVTLGGNGTVPGASVSPTRIDFRVTPPPQTVTVTSSSTGDLHISSVTLGGASPLMFAIQSDGCTRATLAPGAHCTFVVSFATSFSCSSATVLIADDAGDSPQTVILTDSACGLR